MVHGNFVYCFYAKSESLGNALHKYLSSGTNAMSWQHGNSLLKYSYKYFSSSLKSRVFASRCRPLLFSSRFYLTVRWHAKWIMQASRNTVNKYQSLKARSFCSAALITCFMSHNERQEAGCFHWGTGYLSVYSAGVCRGFRFESAPLWLWNENPRADNSFAAIDEVLMY